MLEPQTEALPRIERQVFDLEVLKSINVLSHRPETCVEPSKRDLHDVLYPTGSRGLLDLDLDVRIVPEVIHTITYIIVSIAELYF